MWLSRSGMPWLRVTEFCQSYENHTRSLRAPTIYVQHNYFVTQYAKSVHHTQALVCMR
jgi:hypothetical protein